MFDGKKKALPEEMGIPSGKRFAGILFLIVTLMWTGYLYSTYDSRNQTLDLFGQELVLGEEEHESAHEGETHEEETDDD